MRLTSCFALLFIRCIDHLWRFDLCTTLPPGCDDIGLAMGSVVSILSVRFMYLSGGIGPGVLIIWCNMTLYMLCLRVSCFIDRFFVFTVTYSTRFIQPPTSLH